MVVVAPNEEENGFAALLATLLGDRSVRPKLRGGGLASAFSVLESLLLFTLFLLSAVTCHGAARFALPHGPHVDSLRDDALVSEHCGFPGIPGFASGNSSVTFSSSSSSSSSSSDSSSSFAGGGFPGGGAGDIGAQLAGLVCVGSALGPAWALRETVGSLLAAAGTVALQVVSLAWFLGDGPRGVAAVLLGGGRRGGREAGAGSRSFSQWKIVTFVCLLHTVSALVSIYIQHTVGRSMLTLANFTTADGRAPSPSRLLELWFWSPLKEEIGLRAVVMCALANRSGAVKHPNQKQWYPSLAIWGSSILFGLIHVGNAASGRFSAGYVVLQVLLGIEIGAFYAHVHVLSHGSIAGTLAMHVVNNFWSSLWNSTMGVDLTDPLVSVPLFSTVVIYAALLVWARRQF